MRWFVARFLVVLLASCTPAPQQSGGAPSAAALAPQKAIVVFTSNEPRVLDAGLSSGLNSRDFASISNGFLAYVTPQSEAMPMLAEELPTLENGGWKILTDGRMETTYRLRKSARFHDGTPITAEDFVFAQRVRMDPAIGAQYITVERRMGEVRALDDATLYIEWSEPFIDAGRISGPFFAPMARHLLQPLYEADKDAFLNSALLRDEFVGSGPYRLDRWDRGTALHFRAHEGFALGKPANEQLTMKVIHDGNAMVANLLGGAGDVAFYAGLGFPQGQALEQNGWDGRVDYWLGSVRYLQFQTRDWGNLNPHVADARVRRALLHALDRQSLVDLYSGKTRAVYFWMSPLDPSFAALDRSVMKYEYDPARAEALLREAGWNRDADGMARNAAGDGLQIPLLNQAGDIELQEGSVMLVNWKAVGVTGEMTQMTMAQDRDGEFRSRFPGAAYDRRGFSYDSMVWIAQGLSGPHNRFGGQNRNGYVNPALEENYLRALATVDVKQREGYFVEALKAMTADAVVTPTHLQPRPLAYRRGLVGPKESPDGGGAFLWNIWEWRWS
jgi:peptide/nickel transport system substrate-binding protein